MAGAACPLKNLGGEKRGVELGGILCLGRAPVGTDTAIATEEYMEQNNLQNAVRVRLVSN